MHKFSVNIIFAKHNPCNQEPGAVDPVTCTEKVKAKAPDIDNVTDANVSAPKLRYESLILNHT